MKAKHILALAGVFLATSVGAQQAPPGGDPASHPAPAAAPVASPPMSEGEVRKVDAAQGKVTLRHGPLVNLDMPPMTMVFTADPKLLEGLKQGEKVRFIAHRKDGTYTVTAIEQAR